MTVRKFSLDPEAKQALGRVSPELLKAQLEASLANVEANYQAAGEELIKEAQWLGGQSLDDLLALVGNFDPVDLVNQLVYINPDLDLKDLMHLPVLVPLKALLRVLTISSRFLERTTWAPSPG